jgi:hypothetical protein
MNILTIYQQTSHISSSIPETPDGATIFVSKSQHLEGEILDLYAHKAYLKRDLKSNRVARTILLTCALVGLAVVIMALNGKPSDLGKKISLLFSQKLPGWKVGLIIGLSSFSLMYLTCIFYKAIHGKDRLFENEKIKKHLSDHGVAAPSRGSIHSQQDALIPAFVRSDKYDQESGTIIPGSLPLDQNIDLSTLKDGSGAAFSYAHKGCGESEMIAYAANLLTLAETPFYIVYNVVRAVAIPFYLLGRICYDKYKGNKTFSFKAIP